MTAFNPPLSQSNSDRPTISFIIPCYNERANIAHTIIAVETALRDAGIASYEIIAVDDCSTDGTGSFLTELARNNSRLVLISNPVNLGFGGAYKAGVRRARGVYIIMVPGDNAFPHDGIEAILRKTGEADIVIPYFARPQERHFGRRILSRTFTILLNGMYNLRVPYFNGPVLHRADLLRAIEIKTDGFAFQAEGLIKLIKAGATFTTVGVGVVERAEGRSSAMKLKNIYRVANTLPRLWFEVRRSNDESKAIVSRYRMKTNERVYTAQS